MTLEPGALRAIADELESVQAWASDQLRALLNGQVSEVMRTSDNRDRDSSPQGPAVARTGAGRVAVSGASVPNDQEPEATGGTTPLAAGVDASPGRASGSVALDTVGCPRCDRTGFTPRGLTVHLARLHGQHGRFSPMGRGRALSTPDPLEVPEPLRAHHSYLCPFCNRPFETQADLDAHKLSHPSPAKGRPVGDRVSVGFPGGRPD